MIFIGNILTAEGLTKLSTTADRLPLDTMEAAFSPDMCRQTAETIDHYIRYLLEHYPDTVEREKPLITNIKRFLEETPAFSVTIKELASTFHYNPRYLGRLFKQEAGVSLNEYILARRLKRAMHLLQSTDRGVLDIATEIGFNNVTYFNRQFKAAFGLTPTAYRREAQKK